MSVESFDRHFIIPKVTIINSPTIKFRQVMEGTEVVEGAVGKKVARVKGRAKVVVWVNLRIFLLSSPKEATAGMAAVLAAGVQRGVVLERRKRTKSMMSIRQEDR